MNILFTRHIRIVPVLCACGMVSLAADANTKLAIQRSASATAPHKNSFISSFDDTLTHVAWGGTWVTKLTFLNFRSVPVTIPLTFTDDSGRAVAVPLVNSGSHSNYTVTIPAKGSFFAATEYQPNVATRSGMARVDINCDAVDDNACGNVGLFATFVWKVPSMPDQEAVVPAVSSLEHKSVLAFNQTGGYRAGVVVSQPKFVSFESGTVSVNVVVRDPNGNIAQTDLLTIPAGGHLVFFLDDKYPATKNRAGTVEFSCTGSYISTLELAFNPSGAFSTALTYAPTI